MKALLLMLALCLPSLSWAGDCQSIKWRRLVVGGEMQNNTWTKKNPGIYSSRLKGNDDNCTPLKGKLGLSYGEYQQKVHNDREEYAEQKRQERERKEARRQRDYEHKQELARKKVERKAKRKQERERKEALKKAKRGNGYGDRNHTHTGSRSNHATQSFRSKKAH